ncbi:UPF0481 protein At3g47200-like [Cornus florida]|uniref:UPF0481 protein At3g47200-like n=1 Tax=Cornus florida TaxID=4283 RepID=UPI0028A2D812|nr:UPF0481 protein At3g47200-like [Cornus florida]
MDHCINIEKNGVPDSSGNNLPKGDQTEQGVMDHCINIEKNGVPDSSGNNLPKSSGVSRDILIQEIQCLNKKIHGLPPLFPEPCIFKVHEELRSVNKKAYTPILVSIGPYHHGNPKLREMEEHKLRYLYSLIRRFNIYNNDTIISVKPYLLLMEDLANRAQSCYANPIYLKRNKFVQMMLLDACFVIEFLRKSCYEELRDKDDPIFKSSWMEVQIYRDLMLVENQLPFFVLSELLNKTHIPDSKYVPLPTMAVLTPICALLPKSHSEHKMAQLINENETVDESKHFLDLVHRFYHPSLIEASSGREICSQMSCVTELKEAGISFKVDDSPDSSIFDIKFEDGHMKIPNFRVSDETESFLRNIIAYEQHSSSVKRRYFTDYIWFMDMLINSEKDVNVLRQSGIMDNMMGDDKGVACMFNKLGDGVMMGSSFHYSDVCKKVNDHCGQWWNNAKANLRHTYFNNPWASISTAAAGVLLLLTLTQTAVALIDLLA